MDKIKFYSQKGQDKFIYELFFKKKRNGFFIDIGAHDGISFSNSYFFEKYLGWKGICVEPNPNVFERLRKNKSGILINKCIGSRNIELSFLKITGYGEMLSGIKDSYDPKHLERIKTTIDEDGGKMEEIKIQSIKPDELFIVHQPNKIDFVSIDTEGNEWDIISNFPFNKFKPTVLLIENNY